MKLLVNVLAMAAMTAGADSPSHPVPLLSPTNPPTSSTWTVHGRVMVAHRMPELAALAPSGCPIEGIKVQVSAKEKILGVWGWYNAWETVTTDAGGYFSITRSLSDNERRFKVEVKFQDDDLLEIRHETSTSSTTKVKWYLVYESDTERSPGSVDLGTFTFDSSGSHDLNDYEARSHADIWVLAKKAIDELASYGSAYEFGAQVKIKFPHSSWFGAVEASYANPYTRVVYIHEHDFEADVVLHELMHVWSYDHGTEEAVLADTLVGLGTTHGSTNAPTAFLEGFAEYAAWELMAALFGEDEVAPYNRYHLYDELGLLNLAEVQEHDDGWLSLLRAMTCSDLFHRDFLEPGDYDSSDYALDLHSVPIPIEAVVDVPNLGFKDILRVFMASSSAGYSSDIAFRSVTMTGFLTRAAAILSAMDSNDATNFQSLVNPRGTSQPWKLFLRM